MKTWEQGSSVTVSDRGDRAIIHPAPSWRTIKFYGTYESHNNWLIYITVTPDMYPGDAYRDRFMQVGTTGAWGVALKWHSVNHLEFVLINNNGVITGNMNWKATVTGS